MAKFKAGTRDKLMYWIKNSVGSPVNLTNATSITVNQNGASWELQATMVNGNVAVLFSGTQAACNNNRDKLFNVLASLNPASGFGSDFRLYFWPGVGLAMARGDDEAVLAMKAADPQSTHTYSGTTIDGVAVQVIEQAVGRFVK